MSLYPKIKMLLCKFHILLFPPPDAVIKSSKNCIIQTKSHLNVTSSIVHTLPLLENFNWKAVPLLSLSPSCLQCFCAFPVFTFRETEFVLQDSSLDMGQS